MDGQLYYFILPVRDLPQAQKFFGGVFGWEFAEGGHITSIADPHGGLAAGERGEHAQLWLHTDDVEAAVATVRAFGGESTDVQESRSGWSADCKDASGTSFSIGRMRPEFDVGDGGATSGPGTLRYFTIPVSDLAAGKQFFSSVFGWEYEPEHSSDTYAHVAGSEPACGLVVSDKKHIDVWFMTGDIAAAVARVRELGGKAEEPSPSDSGQSSDCRSPEGRRFSLWQPAPGL
jgi:predicted enzyme related to lactoylglutathione lyase